MDHIGIAVKSVEASADSWAVALGYKRMGYPVVNSRQKVKVLFLERKGSLPIKLIEPHGDDSPLRQFVARGGGLHHICFHCDSIRETLAQLEGLGLRVVSSPQPGEAFCGADIAFVYAGDGVRIELIDTEDKLGVPSVE